MPDFGLLNSAGQIPLLSAPELPDATKSLSNAYTLAGQRVKSEEMVREQREAASDRAVLQQYMQSGADFSTPQGMRSAMQSLQGKLSPAAFERLSEATSKHEQSYAQMAAQMSKIPLEKIQLFQAQQELATPMLGSLIDMADKYRAAKGDAGFDDFWQQGRNALLTDLSQRQIAPGVPMFSPEVLAPYKNGSYDDLKRAFMGSKQMQAVSKTALEMASARKAEALAEELRSGGSGKNTTDLEKYERMFRNGDISREERDRLRAGYIEKHSPKDKSAVLDPDTAEKLARYSMAGGPKIDMASLGSGAAATAVRNQLIKSMFDYADKNGLTPEDMADRKIAQGWAKASGANLTKQESVINVGSNEAETIFKRLQQHLTELGGPDSPIVRKAWNLGASKWMGDPAFDKVRTDVIALKEVMARTMSGISGAGGTPVGYLKLSEELNDENLPLSRVASIAPEVSQVFQARREAVKQEKAGLLSVFSTPGSKIPKEEQAMRDDQAAAQSAMEYKSADEAREALRKTRQAATQATGDAKSILEAEAKRIEGAVKKLEASKPQDGGWKEIAPGVRVRVKPQG